MLKYHWLSLVKNKSQKSIRSPMLFDHMRHSLVVPASKPHFPIPPSYHTALEHGLALEQSASRSKGTSLQKRRSFPELKDLRQTAFRNRAHPIIAWPVSEVSSFHWQPSQQAMAPDIEPRETSSSQSHTVTFLPPGTPAPDIEWACPGDETHLKLNLSPLLSVSQSPGVFPLLLYSCVTLSLIELLCFVRQERDWRSWRLLFESLFLFLKPLGVVLQCVGWGVYTSNFQCARGERLYLGRL